MLWMFLTIGLFGGLDDSLSHSQEGNPKQVEVGVYVNQIRNFSLQ